MAGDDQAPVTLDELADLQAGILGEADERRLRARIDDDPGAAELLGALELVSDELGDLPDDPIPDEVAAGLDRAIEAEAHPFPSTADRTEADDTVDESGGAQVVGLAARRRRRRGGFAALGVAAAAAVVAAVVFPVVNRPAPPQAGSVPAIGAADLAGTWPEVSRVRDPGPLADPRQLRSCLAVAGVFSVTDRDLLGARPVTVDGRSGILLAYPAPIEDGAGRVALVVFDPGCGPDSVLVRTVVDR